MACDTALEQRNGVTAQPERVRGGVSYRPTVDIIENRDELHLVADVPGATPENVEIHYENGHLTINVKVDPRTPAEGAQMVLREYGVGDFYRCFQIGEGIDASRIEAKVRDGVLTVHLPKAEAARPRKIAVKSK
jgi:HSP20 family protein